MKDKDLNKIIKILYVSAVGMIFLFIFLLALNSKI